MKEKWVLSVSKVGNEEDLTRLNQLLEKISRFAKTEENPEILSYCIDRLQSFVNSWDEGELKDDFNSQHE